MKKSITSFSLKLSELVRKTLTKPNQLFPVGPDLVQPLWISSKSPLSICPFIHQYRTSREVSMISVWWCLYSFTLPSLLQRIAMASYLYLDFSSLPSPNLSWYHTQSDHSKIRMSSYDTCRRLQRRLTYRFRISFLCTSSFCSMTVLPMPSKGGVYFSTSLDLGWLNNLTQTNRCQVKWQHRLLTLGLQTPSRLHGNACPAQKDESMSPGPTSEQPLLAAWKRNKAVSGHPIPSSLQMTTEAWRTPNKSSEEPQAEEWS